MNEKKNYSWLLLLPYCIPFAYLCVSGDARNGTMLYYWLMIACFALLCWAALRCKNIPVIYVGNAISLLLSYVTAKVSGLSPMGYYFKPFTAYTLMVVIAVFATILQTIPVLIAAKRNK